MILDVPFRNDISHLYSIGEEVTRINYVRSSIDAVLHAGVNGKRLFVVGFM